MKKRGIDPNEWIGETLADVCRRLGNPDLAEPATLYSAIFPGSAPSVVITYRSLGHRWYLSEQARVLGVIPIKE